MEKECNVSCPKCGEKMINSFSYGETGISIKEYSRMNIKSPEYQFMRYVPVYHCNRCGHEWR